MKTLNLAFNVAILLLLLLVVNQFFHLVQLPGWVIMGVMLVSALLFFVRFYLRMKGR